VLEFAILGFLYETRLHGYELRKRLAALTGHVRPIADGTLYPAIKRLVDGRLVVKELEPGEAAPRHMLMITAAGGDKLLRILREPEDVFISDENHWFCLLAFLRFIDDNPVAQAAVLRRRLDFLSTPASFFYEDGRALRAEDVDDPFRAGMLRIARATSSTEVEWLEATIAELEGRSGRPGMGN
jgi:DNA-binding PadR family transcriptional regulator